MASAPLLEVSEETRRLARMVSEMNLTTYRFHQDSVRIPNTVSDEFWLEMPSVMRQADPSLLTRPPHVYASSKHLSETPTVLITFA